MAAIVDTNPGGASAIQAGITAEIAAIEADYHRAGVDPEAVELWAPCFGSSDVAPAGRPDPQ
jgi:hypothetical protein